MKKRQNPGPDNHRCEWPGCDAFGAFGLGHKRGQVGAWYCEAHIADARRAAKPTRETAQPRAPKKRKPGELF